MNGTANPPRIAAIGDSLIQGFMSGAISKTAVSVPALIARSLGARIPDDFRVPNFPGHGLPLNLEEYLRYCDRRLGSDISGSYEWLIRFPSLFQEYADSVEDLYERGAGSRPSAFGGVYHNLAVWGFRVYDSFTVNSEVCEAAIDDEEGWIRDDFLGLPSAAMYRTAQRVLNPKRRQDRREMTQLSAVEHLLSSEGLDAIILSLGANDCLGTVLSLNVRDMEGESNVPDNTVERTKRYNLTSKKQFKEDYQEMAERLNKILKSVPAKKRPEVFVATVPHVTIPPVTRGIGRFDGKYFEYYGRFFIQQQSFNFRLHSHLTREQAEQIDARIDGFNEVIKKAAEKYKWHLVDLSAALDTLAVRRNGYEGEPARALVDYFAKQQISDHPLLNLDPVPSILRLETNEGGRRLGGGLFSLDCVHPSSCGYGIMADLFLRSMQSAGLAGATPQALNWQQLILQDTLIRSAPATWDDIVQIAQANPWLWDTLFSVMG